jgi:hypothetical protein
MRHERPTKADTYMYMHMHMHMHVYAHAHAHACICKRQDIDGACIYAIKRQDILMVTSYY